jgi:hypothetical protein
MFVQNQNPSISMIIICTEFNETENTYKAESSVCRISRISLSRCGIIYGHLQINPDDNAASVPFEFQNVSTEARLVYSSTGSGIGNGNDGVYVVDFNRDLRTDILLLGGPRPVLYWNTGEAFERSDALPQFDAPMQSALFFDANGDS